MNEILSADDRRHVRTSLIASLAVVFTLLLSTFAWAGVTGPKSNDGRTAPSISAAPADTGAGPDDREMVGCGCAEGCAG